MTNVENMINDYDRNMRQQGLQIQQYLQYLGQSMEQFADSLKPQAEENIKSQLVFEEIIKQENITASDEAVDAKLKEMAEQYKMEADKVKELLGEKGLESVKRDICFHDAIDLCVAEAKLVAEKKTKKADAESTEEETKEEE